MAVWKTPPKIKIYEALGTIADGRIEIEGNSAKVSSSSRGKFYTVNYKPEGSAIMVNDNGSYWQGYLGYPAISFLLLHGVIPYDQSVSSMLKDIKWKDINQKHKNDWDKTIEYVHNLVQENGGNLNKLTQQIDKIYEYLETHPYQLLGKKLKPPSGY